MNFSVLQSMGAAGVGMAATAAAGAAGAAAGAAYEEKKNKYKILNQNLNILIHLLKLFSDQYRGYRYDP